MLITKTETTVTVLTGGCHCGRIRYEAIGPTFHETNCHCSICRRTTGAPFVAWFSVRRTDFRLTQGQSTRYAASPQGTRAFCPHCGTQLTFEHTDFADEIDVTICSLDDPERVAPKDHTRTSSRLAWLKLDDGLPQFAQARD